MLNIYLLRHGQTAWNADNNRYCGRTDIPLTELGIRQAETVHEQLKDIPFDGIYSSPLQRAHVTAKIASGRDVTIDYRLVEADFGTWEKKTKEEFIEENEQLWIDWINDPGNTKAGGTGETAMEVVLRVDDFFRELKNRYVSGNFLVTAHNGVNRLYLAYKLGMPLKHYRRIVQENSSVTLFSLEAGDEIMLKLLNSRLK